MTVLICECGKRVNAPGARPGRVGRCPDCGRRLVVPGEPAGSSLRTAAQTPENKPDREPVLRLSSDPGLDEPAAEDGGSVAGAYDLGPAGVFAPRDRGQRQGRRQGKPAAQGFESRPSGPLADGPLPLLKAPETSLFVSLLHPLRGADALGVLAGLSIVLWIFTVLVPEYCLTAMGDATQLGARMIGVLFAILAALPAVILVPLALFYFLQYLARMLISSARGETAPPRAPDRNPQGVLEGLFPWFIWFTFGVGVAIIPALFFLPPRTGLNFGQALLSEVSVALFGIVYSSTALLLVFLHDDVLAASPLGVVKAWFQLGGELVRIVTTAAVLLLIGLLPVGVAALLRPHHVWFYLLTVLVCWFVALWCMLVYARVLGLIYHRHAKTLGWRRDDPRWGGSWRA